MSPDTNTGNADTGGMSRYLTGQGGTARTAGSYSAALGGNPGTITAAEAGGHFSGYEDAVTNGNAGSGHYGGAKVASAHTQFGADRSSGGGGGSYGDGSGAFLYWAYQSTEAVIAAGNGGGSIHVTSSLTGVTQRTSDAERSAIEPSLTSHYVASADLLASLVF